MVKRVKPNLGWHSGGWPGSYNFESDVLEILKTEIPGLPIESIQDEVAEYIMWRNNEKEKPTLAERKANLELLQKNVSDLLTMLGGRGLDQISHDHLWGHLELAGHHNLFKNLKRDLNQLWRAVLKEQRELDEQKGGRPVNWPQRLLAESVWRIFRQANIKTSTTKDGVYVKALEIIFAAVGEPKQDAQSLARVVSKSLKNKA